MVVQVEDAVAWYARQLQIFPLLLKLLFAMKWPLQFGVLLESPAKLPVFAAVVS